MDTNVSIEQTQRAQCVECGRIFPVIDMIPHAGVRVCANCKPMFLQKLAEGAQIRSLGMQYAGFWLRFGAVFLDGLIILLANLCVLFLTVGFAFADPPQQQSLVLQLLQQLVSFSIGFAYEAFFIGKYGATLGKMACKIEVVTADGGRISYARAVARYFAKLLSTVTLLIGFIMAAFDREGRSLHDRICNTRVVLK